MGGCPARESGGDSGDSIVTIRNLTSVVDPQVTGDPIVEVRGITDVDVATHVPAGNRHFHMGAVAIGFGSTEFIFEDIADAIEKNAAITDTIIVRPLVDWEHFRPNGTGPKITAREVIQIVEHARLSGITHSVIEMDPLLDRHSVSPLPPALEGQDFSSPEVRHAHRAMALDLAETLKPTYLSFAVEVNAYYDTEPEDFDNFVAHHRALYDEVKAVSPETRVVVSMNYEAIQGLLGLVDDRLSTEPRWFLVDKFLGKIDALALSTLPWPVFGRPRDLPDDYFARIGDHVSIPIIITECGWTTAAVAASDEHAQAEYVARIARMSLQMEQIELIAWSIANDPPPGSIFEAFPAFERLGLTRNSGVHRPSYWLWKELFDRPFVPITAPD